METFRSLVYCTEDSQPYVLPVVKKTEAKLIASPQANHEYVPSFGEPRFTKACVEFLLGNDSPAILEGRAHGIQTISGSGALFMGAQFLCQVLNFKRVYLSNPSWGKILLSIIFLPSIKIYIISFFRKSWTNLHPSRV